MQQIETLYEEDNKQRKKKNNKEFILIFLVILIITITCTVGLLKINSKNEETPKLEEKDNYSSEEKKKNVTNYLTPYGPSNVFPWHIKPILDEKGKIV